MRVCRNSIRDSFPRDQKTGERRHEGEEYSRAESPGARWNRWKAVNARGPPLDQYIQRGPSLVRRYERSAHGAATFAAGRGTIPTTSMPEARDTSTACTTSP